MEFGNTLGMACASFAVTNIDDMFVLVTFFAEATASKILTPFKIILGQYIGFTVIIVVSMIGFGASLVLPAEPIGFLGLLPILLGVWKLLCLLFLKEDDTEAGVGAGAEVTKRQSLKAISKVASITVMNGGDNIGTYVPLFAEAEGAEIAVYVVTYYILLGVWCLVAFLVMRQKHVLRLAQKCVGVVLPFLYIGLGIYITIKSECYPWSIEQIDDDLSSDPGITVMAVTTTGVLLICIGVMLWIQWRRRKRKPDTNTDVDPEPSSSAAQEADASTSPDVVAS